MEDSNETLENICRAFYCVALADNRILADEFSKLNEQMESIVRSSFQDLQYDQSTLSNVVKTVNQQAQILSGLGEGNIEHFLIGIAESIKDNALRETIINQCFTIALADNNLAGRESDFIKKLAGLWGLEQFYDQSRKIAGMLG
jgi:uncharacterized tellurite resistance protein B-like protein